MNKDASIITKQWKENWPKAMSTWSSFVRLQEPIWCTTVEQEKKEGLTQSFAMIRLSDHRVVISLRQIMLRNLHDFSIEILAHEVGHHFQYPANLLSFGQMLARMKIALERHSQYAPLVLNLYTDLLINNRLFHVSKLRMDEVYHRLKDPKNKDPIWNLYLRIYEYLWQLPKERLSNALPPDMDIEADIGARIIRIYAKDWMKGGARFALLLQRHFDSYGTKKTPTVGSWMDIHGMDSGDVIPDGLTSYELDEDDLIHPMEDEYLTGSIRDSDGDKDEDTIDSGQGVSAGGSGKPDERVVQSRSPSEYINLLHSMGVKGDRRRWIAQYYKEKARPYLIAFPGKKIPQSSDPLPESLDVWDPGSSMSKIDWMESLFRSPQLIPGVTTVERVYGNSPGAEPEIRPPDVYIGVDCSGSMANPSTRLSYPALAGTVILLSALRAGARSMVCLSGEWNNKGSFKETQGFIRDEEQLLGVLTDYLGTGSYYGPRHLIRTFIEKKHIFRDTHVLIVSDSDLFVGIDALKDGWKQMEHAAKICGSGATAVLNLGSYGTSKNNDYVEKLRTIGWGVAIVSNEKELVRFAKEFSKKTYEG